VLDKITSGTTIRWCGGEPFMSEVYLDIFEYITANEIKNVRHVIQTNGSLLIAKKDVLIKLLPTIKEMRISFDAGCEETYKITRVGGNWKNLLENVKFITNLIKDKNYNTRVYADFVVQKNNYKDLPLFARLCKELNLKINIQKMWNWGTWDDNTFKEMNVYDKDHPLYQDVLALLKMSDLPVFLN
jgi:MoaA/NifB/PqqE/SkfB family radical SAM enzyme